MFQGDVITVYLSNNYYDSFSMVREADGSIQKQKRLKRELHPSIKLGDLKASSKLYYGYTLIGPLRKLDASSEKAFLVDVFKKYDEIQKTAVLGADGVLYYLTPDGFGASTDVSENYRKEFRFRIESPNDGEFKLIADSSEVDIPMRLDIGNSAGSHVAYKNLLRSYIVSYLRDNEFLYVTDFGTRRVDIYGVSMDSDLNIRHIGSAPSVLKDFMVRAEIPYIYDRDNGSEVRRVISFSSKDRDVVTRPREEAASEFIVDVVQFACLAEDKKKNILGCTYEDEHLRGFVNKYMDFSGILLPTPEKEQTIEI